MAREIPEEKLGIVDLRANVGNHSTVHIEVQMTDPYNMFKRLLWYWSRIYGKQLKNKEKYSVLKKTIAILIVNYDIKQLKWFKDSHTKWKLLEERNINIKPFEDIEIHIIELPKIKEYKNETEKGLNTWLEFLINPESEEVKVSKEEDEKLNEAYEKLEYISEDEELRRIADLRLMAILDENSKRERDLKIRKEIEVGKRELEESQKELEESQKELEESQKELEESQKELEESQKELEESQKELEEGQKKLEESKKKLEKEKNEFEEAKAKMAKKMKEKNFNVQDIIDMTGSSKEEIENL